MPDPNGVVKRPQGGFSSAPQTWLPISHTHLERTGLDAAENENSIYRQFASFLAWRKAQPAFMTANLMSLIPSADHEIILIEYPAAEIKMEI